MTDEPPAQRCAVDEIADGGDELVGSLGSQVVDAVNEPEHFGPFERGDDGSTERDRFEDS